MRLAMDAPPTGPDATAGPLCQDDGNEAVDERGRRYLVEERGVRVTAPSGRARWIALDDPSAPRFVGLPNLDLPDGRRLRDTAFLVWAAHVRALLAAGRSFETTYRARRPFHTAFGIAGGLLLGGGTLTMVARFVNAPRRVWIEPGFAEWVLLLGALAFLLWVANEALSAAARLWLCRRGSYVRVGADGIVVVRGGSARSFASVEDAIDHPWVRAVELRLAGGKSLWVPRESGPLVRPDLVLAALDDGVRERVLRRL